MLLSYFTMLSTPTSFNNLDTTWKKPVFCLNDGLLTNMPSTIPLGKNCSPLVKAPQEIKDTCYTTITTITITIDIRVHVRDWKHPNTHDHVAY